MPARRTNAALTRTRRLEGLSDATFAIILTLLVLEIHRPSVAPGHLAQSLAREWPSYLAYAMAFINIGVTWLNHHYVYSQIEHTDLTLNWINFAILGTATLIPFPHGRPGRCLRQHQPRRPAGGSGALRRDRIPRNRGYGYRCSHTCGVTRTCSRRRSRRTSSSARWSGRRSAWSATSSPWHARGVHADGRQR